MSRTNILHLLLRFTCHTLGILALFRLLYEGLFPQLSGLGDARLVVPLALGVGAASSWLSGRSRTLHPGWLWLPLLLNLVWLFNQQPQLNVPLSRLTFLGSLWGIGYWATLRARPDAQRGPHLLFSGLALGGVYLATLGRSVGRADTFEFQVTAPQLGIVHPTGYPLYLLLGKLWTLLPVGEVALRLNLGTAVYGVATGLLICLIVQQLTGRGLWGSAAAITFGLRPTFWSQAIEAEVYTLHNLIVALALWLLLTLPAAPAPRRRRFVWLAALLGLGLTNHLTTVFLLPATGLLFLWDVGRDRPAQRAWAKTLGQAVIAGLLPLSLYAYLPLRWQAVNGEPMGTARFIDWVVGGRFQDALQWAAWWRDPTRYAVVGRLFSAEWPLCLLLLGLAGLLWLTWRSWRQGLVLLLTGLGFTFYCLNYYVPDLNVFLLPAQLVLAIGVGLGLSGLAQGVGRTVQRVTPTAVGPALAISLLLFVGWQATQRYPALDRSADDGRVTWARGVLAQPLAEGSAVLADSAKFPPLYYVQQTAGLRPDLDIMVLPDEAAYRAELEQRLATGETVYLARFLPGLEGITHLRAAGPLVEVSTEPQFDLPLGLEPLPQPLGFGPDGVIELRATSVEPQAAADPAATALTLYWRASQPVTTTQHVFVRWAGGPPLLATGQLPANNSYPTVAWDAGEIVLDYHLLPRPMPLPLSKSRVIEVALAPPFTPLAELTWQPVATVPLIGTSPALPPDWGGQPLAITFGESSLTTAAYPRQLRPNQAFAVEWLGAPNLNFALEPETIYGQIEIEGQRPLGTYRLTVSHPTRLARCGWLQPLTPTCDLGQVQVSGVALPEEATNFGDLIGLLQAQVVEPTLTPGGRLAVDLRWQALAPIPDDYTITVQLLDAADQVIVQTDAYPLQGTFPTSQWALGEIVNDPYQLALPADLPPGRYRLLIGLYRLADVQRLSVLDADGTPLDNRLLIEGLVVVE